MIRGNNVEALWDMVYMYKALYKNRLLLTGAWLCALKKIPFKRNLIHVSPHHDQGTYQQDGTQWASQVHHPVEWDRAPPHSLQLPSEQCPDEEMLYIIHQIKSWKINMYKYYSIRKKIRKIVNLLSLIAVAFMSWVQWEDSKIVAIFILTMIFFWQQTVLVGQIRTILGRIVPLMIQACNTKH